MKLIKANLAGLTSPGQQSEMKSILAGSWPPLKPLPVFKYETPEYRATVDFDKKRGEWVCRKTSLPSNEVQELRGGLQAITMALPHGETEIFTEGAEHLEGEQQEHDLERDAHRRLQAIHEWREKYENGARYFELQDFLSQSQRTELDDSLRHTLTARQLQFNSRNVADVFDDLSVAGGRFAALIEFATRSKANRGIAPQAQEEGSGVLAEAAALYNAEPEAEPTANDVDQFFEVSSGELEPVLNSTEPNDTEPNNNDAFLQNQEATASEKKEQRTDAEEFPAFSIKNVFPEPEQPSMAERMAHALPQPFELEDSEIAGKDSAALVEPPHEEEPQIPAFTGFAAQVRGGQSFAEPIEGSSSRFPALKVSAFQANVFALLFLFAATSFTVGLTVGRGPLGKRLREPPQSLLDTDAKPSALPDQSGQAQPDQAQAQPQPGQHQPDQVDESSSQTPTPPVASSDDSAGAEKLEDARPSEEKPTASGEKPEESPPSAGLEEARSTDSDSSPTAESKPSVKPGVVRPEVSTESRGAIEPVPRRVLPPVSRRLVRRPKVVSKAVRSMRSAPRRPAPYRLPRQAAAVSVEISSAPRLPRPSTVLVTVPERGSQPFRVSFSKKTIAATSSLAMTSELSVLVFPQPGLSVVHKSARLEAGELLSFVWPRYQEPRARYGLAETIRVRATIGPLGQVQEVKFLGGSMSLLPATMAAVRQWRYRPSLLDQNPVQAQQDVTIEFRPPQYSARVSIQHPSHN